MSRCLSLLRSGILLATLTASASAADWPQFRGPDSAGTVSGDPLPREISAGDIQWTFDLTGRGLSSPVIAGKALFATQCDGYDQDQLSIVAIDRQTGQQLWKRTVQATGRTSCHPSTCMAAPSCVTDGEYVIGFYSTNDVLCLRVDGSLVWHRGLTLEFPNASNSLGMASSPIIGAGVVVCPVENDTESFSIAIELASGKTRWKLDRPRQANWTSPILRQGSDGLEVLLQSAKGVSAHNLATGAQTWAFTESCATMASSTLVGADVLVPSGGLKRLKVDGPTAEVVWAENSLRGQYVSAVVSGDRVYTINPAGVLLAANTQTGAVLWKLRIEGSFAGCPIVQGQYLYAVNDKGVLSVVELGESEGKVVSSYDFGETIQATPAAADGELYLRSDLHIWKIAARN